MTVVSRRSSVVSRTSVVSGQSTIIAREGASISWYRKPDGTAGEMQDHFFVYDREGEPCYHCGQPIEKIRVAQRGTHFCPECQPLVTVLVTE